MDSIEQILMMTPVEHSRDQLLMRKDNIAHFMSVDCKISTPICQQLIDLQMINIKRLKTKPIGVGAIVQTNLSNGKIIYSLFIKEKSNEIAASAIGNENYHHGSSGASGTVRLEPPY